jgi:hypothetical protein
MIAEEVLEYEKVGTYVWKVKSRSKPLWYKVYYRNCGGHCDCPSFRYSKKCPHLDFIKSLVEQSGEFDAPSTFEEEILYE